MAKVQRQRVRKHRRDYNHGRSGWIAGNPRYDRRNPLSARSMVPGVKPPGRDYRGNEE